MDKIQKFNIIVAIIMFGLAAYYFSIRDMTLFALFVALGIGNAVLAVVKGILKKKM